MYSKVCKIMHAQSYVQHHQCERCFMLTHNMLECRRPAKYKWCGICGKPGHLQSEHKATHCPWLHPTLKCNCAPYCFNCGYRGLPTKGHYTFGDNCPLKKNMRHHGSAPARPLAPVTSRPMLALLAVIIKPTPTLAST